MCFRCDVVAADADQYNLLIIASEECSYLGNFAKLVDDVSVAVDDLLLEVKPQLATSLRNVLHMPGVELTQSFTEFRIRIRCRENRGDLG